MDKTSFVHVSVACEWHACRLRITERVVEGLSGGRFGKFNGVPLGGVVSKASVALVWQSAVRALSLPADEHCRQRLHSAGEPSHTTRDGSSADEVRPAATEPVCFLHSSQNMVADTYTAQARDTDRRDNSVLV